MAEANKLGLPEVWRKRLAKAGTRPLELTRIAHDTPAADKLQTGDLLLALNKQPINSLIELDLMTQADTASLTVLREGKVLTLAVDTVERAYEDLNHIVFWAGALIQPPPLSLSRQRQLPTEGAYVSFYRYGSPASRGGMVASLTITELNDQPVTNMADFVRIVASLGDTKIVRVRARHLNQNPALLTLRLDQRYWPTYQLKRSANGWQRSALGD